MLIILSILIGIVIGFFLFMLISERCDHDYKNEFKTAVYTVESKRINLPIYTEITRICTKCNKTEKVRI